MMLSILDILLVFGLLLLGWRAVVSPDLFNAIIWFIILGLFMALCWARLGAPDIALVEAAIGAGFTGALLLNAFWHLQPTMDTNNYVSIRRKKIVLACLCAGFFIGILFLVLVDITQTRSLLSMLAYEQIPKSGVGNPVTAVLLNFRAYDTMLEVVVLLLALMGVWVIQSKVEKTHEIPILERHESPIINAYIKILFPFTILVAGYMLWAGAHSPGGAFQAAAVLAAIGVLLSLTNNIKPTTFTPFHQLLIAMLGLIIFTCIAFETMIFGNGFLAYQNDLASTIILLIESSLTLSIGLILVILFNCSMGIHRGMD
jgi:multisubunit Na+/H+ antiporter MnhB subunit